MACDNEKPLAGLSPLWALSSDELATPQKASLYRTGLGDARLVWAGTVDLRDPALHCQLPDRFRPDPGLAPGPPGRHLHHGN